MPEMIEALRRQKMIAEQHFHESDAAWAKLLPKVADARYLPIGRGAPGGVLRQAHEARERARESWEIAASAYRAADLEAFRSRPKYPAPGLPG
jgi:hypothetical protein